MGRGEVVERADELVHQMRQTGGAGGAAAILDQHFLRHVAAGEQPLLEQANRGVANFRRRTVASGRGSERGQFAAQGIAVYQFVEFRGDFRHSRFGISCFGRGL